MTLGLVRRKARCYIEAQVVAMTGMFAWTTNKTGGCKALAWRLVGFIMHGLTGLRRKPGMEAMADVVCINSILMYMHMKMKLACDKVKPCIIQTELPTKQPARRTRRYS